jgi:uncharacterized delta-60 repeat protein
VVGGYQYDGTLEKNLFTLIKFKTDGNLDSSFGTDGISIAEGFDDSNRLVRLVLQPDGKIIAGGTRVNSITQRFFVMRFTADGEVDNTFGTNGGTVIDVGAGQTITSEGSYDTGTAELRSAIIQNDGKIVVSGYVFPSALDTCSFVAARLNANGSLDTTFGTNGLIVTSFDYAINIGAFGLIQPDGGIVFGGSSYAVEGVPINFSLARYITFTPDTANICFVGSTIVNTDVGYVRADNLDERLHTINGNPIRRITKTSYNYKYLIRFKKDFFQQNIPDSDTVVSPCHKVLWKNSLVRAEIIPGVERVPYTGAVLYNILFDEYSTIKINNMIVESLHPTNKFLVSNNIGTHTNIKNNSTVLNKRSTVRKVAQKKIQKRKQKIE